MAGQKITISFELDSEKDAHTILQLHEFKKAFNVIRRIHLEIFKQYRGNTSELEQLARMVRPNGPYARGILDTLEANFWGILEQEKLNHDALPRIKEEYK